MPRNYQRTTNRGNWPQENMYGAITAVLEGRMGSRKASKLYGVPQSTVLHRVKKARRGGLTPLEASGKMLGRHRSVFSKVQEKMLAELILQLDGRLFNLTAKDIRELSFEFAEKINARHTFIWKNRTAGKDWIHGFMKRHRELLVSRDYDKGMTQSKGLNRTTVKIFFDLLHSLYEEFRFPPEDIYNVDEVVIRMDSNRASRILNYRSKRQLEQLSSMERGTLVTAETCINAAGEFLPTMFVFPKTGDTFPLMNDAPPDSFAVFHETGYINKDSFLVWFKKFIQFSQPSPEKPVLLIFNGQAGHVKSLHLINLAREHNVEMVCFPPHAVEKLQPLDVAFKAQVQGYYRKQVKKWVISNPDEALTVHEVGPLYQAAFSRAALRKTAVEGFAKTGIYPFNRDVIPEELYAPDEPTNVNETVQFGAARTHSMDLRQRFNVSLGTLNKKEGLWKPSKFTLR